METKRYDGPSVVVGVVPSGLLQEGRPAWLVAVLDVDGQAPLCAECGRRGMWGRGECECIPF